MANTLVTRKELAVAFDVHEQTVTKWERDGMPIAERGTRGRPSRYRLPEVVAWYVNRELKARGVGVDLAALNPQAERALLDRRRREEVDLKLGVRRGQLLDAREVERATFEVARTIRDGVQNIPHRLSHELAAETDPAKVHARLAEEIDNALTKIADILSNPPAETVSTTPEPRMTRQSR